MKSGGFETAAGLAAIVAIVAASAVAGFVAAERRPLWSYHNGNTLFASPAQYQLGYAIGVLDGYLAAHERARENGEGPAWLDVCLSDGRPAPPLSEELIGHFRQAFRHFDQKAADILLDYMLQSCARAARAAPAHA